MASEEDLRFTLVVTLTFGGFAFQILAVFLARLIVSVVYKYRLKRATKIEMALDGESVLDSYGDGRHSNLAVDKKDNRALDVIEEELEERAISRLYESNSALFIFQSYNLRRRFAFWLTSTVSGYMWQMLQLVITLVSCALYIVELYAISEGREVPNSILFVEVALNSLFAIDYCFNFYASSDRLRHLCFSPYALVDWITFIPFFVSWASGDPFNADRNDELFIRSLRLFRAIRIIRCYRLLPFSKDAFIQQIINVVLSFFIFIFIATSIIQFIEDNLDAIPGVVSLSPFDWYAAFYCRISSAALWK